MNEKLKDGYILYQPSNQWVLPVHHFEVWLGLPTGLKFYEVEARTLSHVGLRAETERDYVWVDPDTASVG